jgi:maleylpyruvate isomerase
MCSCLAAERDRGDYCFGHGPTLAEVYFFSQVESARIFNVEVPGWPRISAVDVACSRLDAFRVAAPALQPDAIA